MSTLLNSGMVGDNFSIPWLSSKDIPKKAILKVRDWKVKKDFEKKREEIRRTIFVSPGVFTTERDISGLLLSEIKVTGVARMLYDKWKDESVVIDDYFLPVRNEEQIIKVKIT